MPTFIDERGDTGLLGETNSEFFQLAAVWIPTQESADAFSEAVRNLKNELNLPPHYEFKFSKCLSHPDRIEAFLRTALLFDFRFAFHSWNKKQNPKKRGSEVQTECVDRVVDLLKPAYSDFYRHHVFQNKKRYREKILVDNNDDRSFLRIIENSFRKIELLDLPKTHMTISARFRESKTEVGIQLADIIVGACGLYLDGRGVFYEMIAERCL
ncbi:MAG: DUF3800 domain-containing protein [Fimbriiglobus sp.]